MPILMNSSEIRSDRHVNWIIDHGEYIQWFKF